MRFENKYADYALSPFTGLTRESWIDAAKYVLDGVFRHINHFNDPVVLTRIETEITYPHKNADSKWLPVEQKAESFEGLCRTFFIAAPLLVCDPQVEIRGYRLADYYKAQVLRACTPGDPVCAGTYEELQDLIDHVDPFRSFQQTVETCALVICLNMCREAIWDKYTKEEKDTIAAFIDSFAKAGTVPQNWRLFNMLDLAFLDMNGYRIDVNIMRDHSQAILAYYAGDGWYRDGAASTIIRPGLSMSMLRSGISGTDTRRSRPLRQNLKNIQTSSWRPILIFLMKTAIRICGAGAESTGTPLQLHWKQTFY